MIFKRQAQPGWMAITLQAQHVCLAHVVRAQGAAPRVALLDRAPRAATESETDTLTQLRRSAGLQRFRCTTALDHGSYQFVQLNAPAVPDDEMKAALRWSVKDALDFPAEHAVIDLLRVPAGGATQGQAPQAFAIAARREKVAERMQAFQKAQVPLHTIDIAEVAQRNVAALFEQAGRGLALLTINERGGLLTFTRDGELYAARRIDADPAAFGDAAEVSRREAALERIGLELQRSLDNFDRQFSQIALQRLLVCVPTGCRALLAYLGQNLYLPVETADLGAVLDLRDAPMAADPDQQVNWLQAIGLALRDEAA